MVKQPTAAVGALLLAAGSLFIGSSAASADSFPSSECVIDCVVTIDTAGSGSVAVPAGVTSLTVTVAGGAGVAPSQATRIFPDAVGGAGGVTTVELGSAGGGTTFSYIVGGTSEGSAVGVDDSTVLVVAGGGGDSGYAGRLDLDDPDQIFGFFPGGVGGAPTAPGFAAGGDGTAPEANGFGASVAVGAGGPGSIAVGNAGGYADMAAGTITLGAAGLGGTASSPDVATSHLGGSGGTGAYGGGGGGVTRTEIDENPLYIVGAGGGGSGYLAGGLTGVASTNEGAGYVTFEWSYSPSISMTVSTVHAGDTVTATIAGLPASRAFSVVFDGAVVASGSADASGAASVSFAVASTQRAGSFPLTLTVADVTVAASAAVTVEGPVLAATGAETTVPLIVGGVLLLGGAVALIVTRIRRRGPSED